MSTVGPNIFLGRYFDMLHTSAENIRDARETQHLRSQISSNSSETYSKKRSREQSPKGSSSKSRKPKSGNLENFKHKSPSKKFSKKAREYISKSRRLSTQQLYHSRLSIYHSWCDQQNVLPDSATVEQMADFFIYLHEKRKLKAVTISGYRSSIATLHKGLGKVWNPLFIPQFDRFATDERDLLLCPCRSLKEYVKRTKSIRGQIENLFLTYQKGFCKAAAKTTLSRWIVSLIRYVYDKLPDLNLGEVRAHDTRRLATSWALFNGASVQSILQASHWATETIFTSFYLKDVGVEDSFAKASVSAHNTRRLATSWALFYGASVQSILQVAYWATETTFTSFYLKDVGLEDRFAKASVLKTTNWAGERKKQTCSEDKH
ncbi:hypothetical protein KUTeg_001610 [Tegillarca granosa]|uniref:Core-binding (CB) domain-containing protein n=1 Tax=Tegillarca granosa TaxID=220873 RepID=A0ABQ9FWE1_TEGGR|nr:hypothetical protein KUTeg_001610 [Tegillarca granosa]